jgi:hypothetical protein
MKSSKKSTSPKKTTKKSPKLTVSPTPKNEWKQVTPSNETKDSSKKNSSKTNVSKSSNKRNTVTTYIPVSKHIYSTGTSYRVRVSINGETVSVSTTSKTKAFKVRKHLLSLRSAS